MKNTSSRVLYPIKISLKVFLCVFIATTTFAAAVHALPPLQQHQITGIVTDQNGLPIPGVAVRIKNSTTGTITNPDGIYTINATSEDILVFTYLGFQSMEVPVDSRTEINLRLEEDVTALGEVEINAGYYLTTRRESTGNISRVTAEEIDLQPVVSPLEALQGRMAGVEILPSSSHTGAASTIRIRGRNSLREDGNYPLYIIDGVPINSTPIETNSIIGDRGMDPLNFLDLSSIESIEVLKDADATAIYGSRGANGVVLITTKRGQYGKAGLEARVYTGATTVPNRLNLLNTEEYLKIRRQAFENDGVEPTILNAYDLVAFDQNRYTDWQDFFFGETSNTTNISLATSGGNENTTFRLGGSYRKQGSVYLGDFDYRKVTGNLNLNHRSRNQKFDIQLGVNYGVDNNNLSGVAAMNRNAFRLPPNAPEIFSEDGSLNWEEWTEVGLSNPVEGFFNSSETQSNNIITSLGLTYVLLDGLKIRSNLGYTYLSSKELAKRPRRSYNPINWGSIDNSSSHMQNYRKSWIIEPQLIYEKRIRNSSLDALIGGTFQESGSSNVNYQAQGYVSEALIGNLSAADLIINGTSVNSNYRYNALFGRIGYTWDDKYILNLTGRRDGSSRFGPGKKLANFWAVGGAWSFAEEAFIQRSLPFLSFGKFRMSYGTTGSDHIGDYGYLDSYEATIGPGGLYPTQLANPDYSWEENKKLEAGLELGFFEDRLDLGVSWYRNRSSNQLVGYALPATTGFTSVQANLPATVQNTGFEVVLSSSNFNSTDFSWETSINMSFPRNKLVSYPDLDQSSYANVYRVGYPLNISMLYQYEGIDPETGFYTVKDVNEDGRISMEDRVVIQDLGKKIFGGINNNLRYKNLSLQFLWEFAVQEGTVHFYNPGELANQRAVVMRAFDVNNDFQKISVSTAARTAYSNMLSSDHPIQDASFFRLKTLTLSYSLPMRVLKPLGLERGSIFFNGHNLVTISNYEGMDPDSPQIGLTILGFRTIAGGIQINL